MQRPGISDEKDKKYVLILQVKLTKWNEGKLHVPVIEARKGSNKVFQYQRKPIQTNVKMTKLWQSKRKNTYLILQSDYKRVFLRACTKTGGKHCRFDIR